MSITTNDRDEDRKEQPVPEVRFVQIVSTDVVYDEGAIVELHGLTAEGLVYWYDYRTRSWVRVSMKEII
jgi:hypothetical protein